MVLNGSHSDMYQLMSWAGGLWSLSFNLSIPGLYTLHLWTITCFIVYWIKWSLITTVLCKLVLTLLFRNILCFTLLSPHFLVLGEEPGSGFSWLWLPSDNLWCAPASGRSCFWKVTPHDPFICMYDQIFFNKYTFISSSRSWGNMFLRSHLGYRK